MTKTLFIMAAHRCFETNLVCSMRGSLEARKLGRRAGRAALSANSLQADRHARGRLGRRAGRTALSANSLQADRHARGRLGRRRAGRAAVSANSLQADRHARGRLVSTDFTRLNILLEQDPPSL
jgi:hypothetical protein